MVAAYLRGLLKPATQYGLRSSLAEDAVIEAMVAQMQLDSHELNIQVDSAILTCLDDKSKKSTMKAINAKIDRCIDLRSLDIYRLDRIKVVTQNKNDLSLYQLYHIAKKCGILDALAEEPEEPET